MKLRVYSKRWGREEDYSVERTQNGWKIHGQHIFEGESDKTGEPQLFDCLDREFIDYPAKLGEYMEWLWEKVEENQMGIEEIQKCLDDLGKWISTVEKSSPEGIWKEYRGTDRSKAI